MDIRRTERLEGRPCQPGDGPVLARLMGEPDVARWAGPGGRPWSAERAEIFALRLAAHWLAHGWGPRLWFEGDRFVCVLGLRFAILAGRGAVEVSFAVPQAERRRGYAREALAATLAEARGIVREVEAAVAEANAPSRRLLAAAGFAEWGRAEEEGMALVLCRRPVG